MSRPVKIAVMEPSLILRRGIMSVLKSLNSFSIEFQEIGETDHLKNSLSWQKPDILIINPTSLGLITPQQMCKEADKPDMKCVALVSSLTDSSILKYYDGVISLYDSAETIREKLNRLISEPETDKRHETLSAREKEVVVCVIQGMTNKQIADKLYLSTHTVITHRRNISAKLQIHSTAGLTIYAIVNKLVELDKIKPQTKE